MTSSLVFVALLTFNNFILCNGQDNVMDNVNVNININVNKELKREMETMRQEIARLTERLCTVENNLSGEFYGSECPIKMKCVSPCDKSSASASIPCAEIDSLI